MLIFIICNSFIHSYLISIHSSSTRITYFPPNLVFFYVFPPFSFLSGFASVHCPGQQESGSIHLQTGREWDGRRAWKEIPRRFQRPRGWWLGYPLSLHRPLRPRFDPGAEHHHRRPARLPQGQRSRPGNQDARGRLLQMRHENSEGNLLGVHCPGNQANMRWIGRSSPRRNRIRQAWVVVGQVTPQALSNLLLNAFKRVYRRREHSVVDLRLVEESSFSWVGTDVRLE